MLDKKDSLIEELIAQMASGNITSMGKLYELIKTDVYAYALSKLANRVDAEDITHDTFVLIYKYAKQYKPMGKPLAWIFRIELNLVRKHYNDNKNNVSFDEAILAKPTELDFSTQIVNSEFLNEIMRSLNEDEREVISLHVVSGLKHREIAKLLERPLSTILSKYNRAIKKLQAYKGEVGK